MQVVAMPFCLRKILAFSVADIFFAWMSKILQSQCATCRKSFEASCVAWCLHLELQMSTLVLETPRCLQYMATTSAAGLGCGYPCTTLVTQRCCKEGSGYGTLVWLSSWICPMNFNACRDVCCHSFRRADTVCDTCQRRQLWLGSSAVIFCPLRHQPSSRTSSTNETAVPGPVMPIGVEIWISSLDLMVFVWMPRPWVVSIRALKEPIPAWSARSADYSQGFQTEKSHVESSPFLALPGNLDLCAQENARNANSPLRCHLIIRCAACYGSIKHSSY